MHVVGLFTTTKQRKKTMKYNKNHELIFFNDYEGIENDGGILVLGV